MTNNDVKEMVLRTLLNFDFLMSIDEAYERDDKDARAIVTDFFLNKFPDDPKIQQELVPFLYLKTTLPMLVVPLCFAAKESEETWQQLGWNVQEDYKIIMKDKDGNCPPTTSGLLKTMRNAMAHVPYFMHDSKESNVSWDERCLVRFVARRPPGSVEFKSPDGFRLFLSDFIRYVRRASCPEA